MICGVSKKSILKKFFTCILVMCLLITSLPAEFEVSADESVLMCHEHRFVCVDCLLSLEDYISQSVGADSAPVSDSHTHDFRCEVAGCGCTPDEADTVVMEHDFSTQFTVDEEPTFDTKGVKSRHCLRCGERTDITEIPPLSETRQTEQPLAVIPKKDTDKEPSRVDPVKVQQGQGSAETEVGSNGAAIEFTSTDGDKILISIDTSGSDILKSSVSQENDTVTTVGNGGKVSLTWSNIPQDSGENIFSAAYNRNDGAYYMQSTVDKDKKADFSDLKNTENSDSDDSENVATPTPTPRNKEKDKSPKLTPEELQELINTLASLGIDYYAEQGTDSEDLERQREEEALKAPDKDTNKSSLPSKSLIANSVDDNSLIDFKAHTVIVNNGNSKTVINIDSLTNPAYQLDFELKFKVNASGNETELTEFNTKMPVKIELSEETRKSLGPNVTAMVFNNHNDELNVVDSFYDHERGEITMNIDKCSPFEVLLYNSNELFLTDSEAVLKLKKTVKTGQSFTAGITGFTNGDNYIGFSDDESIATVDSDGVITGVSEGKTTITYYVIRGNKNYEYIIELTVKDLPGVSLSIRPDRLVTDTDGALVFNVYKAVKLGNETRIAMIRRNPGVKVTYSSSDESVASVNHQGYIMGLKKGFATITVEVTSGEDRMVYALLVRVCDGTKDKEIKQYLRK